jgi:predicted molibdopterin-dependent oxidoreductase YjgC
MKVTIDGQAVKVEPGTTILQAARMIGGESVPPMMFICQLFYSYQSIIFFHY